MTVEQAVAWTTSAERAAAAAFGSERRRQEFLAWRALVRRELGRDVRIEYDAAGAPILCGRSERIGVAHCPGRVAVAISDRPCAVDIEPESRDFARAAARYLTPAERALCDEPLWPGVVWCAKETLYKLSGRRELDFLRDLHVEAVDFASGAVTGRIADGDPIRLTLRREQGYLIVYRL